MAFIKQEALEKAREIKVKADEEFAIEKVRYSIIPYYRRTVTDSALVVVYIAVIG